MGMNLTLAFEADVPGVTGRNVEAYDLCKGKTMDKLDAIAKQLGMTFLDDFPNKPDLKHLSNEQQFALLFGGWNEKQWGPEPADLWHDPAEGLAVVRAIRNYLAEHPTAIRSGKRELAEFEKALESAREHGVRFHVYIDA